MEADFNGKYFARFYQPSQYGKYICLKMQTLGVTADMASYNILLKACSLAGKLDLAQDIYREVKQLESTGLLKLDVFTYCTIIKVSLIDNIYC